MRLGERLINNPWLAFGMIFFASGLPLVGWLAGIILVLVTLRQGIVSGAFGVLAGVSGMLLSGLMLSLLVLDTQTRQSFGGIFLHLPPLFLMATVLRMRVSLSQALVSGAGYYMILAVGLSALGMLPTTEMLMNSVGQQLGQAINHSQIQEQQTNKMISEVVVAMSYSWMAILYLANCILLFIGRSWQARLFNHGGFRTEFQNLRLSPLILAIILPVAATVTYSQNMPFSSVVCGVIACVLLIFPGVALIHWYVHYKKRSIIWLVTFYMLFLLNFITPAITAMMLTIIDTFVDVRQRIQRKL